jgi:hypothetical protein
VAVLTATIKVLAGPATNAGMSFRISERAAAGKQRPARRNGGRLTGNILLRICFFAYFGCLSLLP